jgi:hypothetical protein
MPSRERDAGGCGSIKRDAGESSGARLIWRFAKCFGDVSSSERGEA